MPRSLILVLCLLSFAHLEARGDPGPPRTDASGDPLPEGARVRLGSLRFRHRGKIAALAYSPDGKLLASLGDGNHPTICLWEADSGKLLHSIEGAAQPSMSPWFAFGPDGRTLMTNGVLLDVASGKPVSFRTPLQHNTHFNRVVVSPDGKSAALVRGSIHLRDLATDKDTRVFKVMGAIAPSHCSLRMASSSSAEGTLIQA